MFCRYTRLDTLLFSKLYTWQYALISKAITVIFFVCMRITLHYFSVTLVVIKLTWLIFAIYSALVQKKKLQHYVDVEEIPFVLTTIFLMPSPVTANSKRLWGQMTKSNILNAIEKKLGEDSVILVLGLRCILSESNHAYAQKQQKSTLQINHLLAVVEFY